MAVKEAGFNNVEDPRPPTQLEIAQAIVDHLTEANGGVTPDDVSSGYMETYDWEGKQSLVSYYGEAGSSEFVLPWPDDQSETQ